MWDEGATQSLNPSYQPLNVASIPDRRLDGYALKAARENPGRANGSVWKKCRARGKRLTNDLGVRWPSSCHDTSPTRGTQRNERNGQWVGSNVG